MYTSKEIAWYTPDNSELIIAYNGAHVVVGFKEADSLLRIHMTTAIAIHLMMELRESLKDINTEDSGEEY